METVLRAPFAARVQRAARSSAGSQVETGAPLLRLEPVGDDDAAAEAAGRGRRPRAARRARRPARRADRGPRAACDDLRSLLLGYDVDPRDEGRTLAGYLAARGRARRATAATGRGRARRCCSVFADLAELSRNRPAGEEPTPTSRVHSPREHFHTYLQSLDVERGGAARGVPRPAGAGARALRRRPTWTARPRWRRRCSGSSWPSSGTSADVAVVTALLQRWLRRAAARRRARRARSREVLDRLVARHPAALPGGRRPGPQRPVPLVRPAAGRRGPGRGATPACATSCATWPTQPGRRRTAPSGSRRWPRSPSRSSGSSAERLERGRPRARADARGADPPPLPRARAARPARARRSAGAPFVVADYSLDDRPTHLVSTVGTVAELADRRRRRWSTALGRAGRGPAGARVVVDLYLSWPDAPRAPTRWRPRCATLLAALPLADAGAPRSRSPCAPGGGRPVHLLHLPARTATGIVEDDLVRGLHPMVGQRLQPVAAAQLRRSPGCRRARGRAALPLRRPGQPGRRAAGRAGPGPRARPSCATQDGQVVVAAARRAAPSPAASRRSAGRAGAAAATAPGST